MTLSNTDLTRNFATGKDSPLGVGGYAEGGALYSSLSTLDMEECDVAGRPLFAAHMQLPWPDEPHLVLWHAATLLREHRGDGHVAALLTAGLDGCVASPREVRPLRNLLPPSWIIVTPGVRPAGGATDDQARTATPAAAIAAGADYVVVGR